MSMIVPEGLREGGASRRRFRRFQVALPALAWPECLGLDPADAHEHPLITKRVCIENMSLTGLLIATTTPFYLGTRLIVKFTVDDMDIAVKADVLRVAKTEADGKHCFGHGSCFVKSDLTADALPAIADYLGDLSRNVRTPVWVR